MQQGLPLSGGSLLANRPEAAERCACKRLARRAGSIEVPHRFVQAAERCVEVGAGLLKRGMAEHVLHVVDRPTALDQARAGFVAKVVEGRLIALYAASDSGLSLVLPLSFGPIFFFQIQTGL